MFDNRFGPINQIIGWIAGEPVLILWTINPHLVYPAIIAAEVWQWTPFMFLLLLAALSNVDKSQLEAAAIDGAGYWRTFFRIVLPAIWPVMAIAILIRGLDLFRLFDIVWALTKGGPGTMTETISIFTYVKGFQQFETSYTAAVAFLIIVLLSVVVIAALQARGARPMMAAICGLARSATAHVPPACALCCGHRRHARLPVPDLLAVHDLVQDAGGDLRIPAELVSAPASSSTTTPCCSRMATRSRLEQPGRRRREHGDRHVPRHDLRLQPRALQDRRRATSPTGSSRSAWCRRSRSCSRSSCSTSGSAGSTPTLGVILLYTAFNLPYVIWMMRGYILDIPLALEESRAGRRLHALAGDLESGVPDGARRPVRDRDLHLRVRLERVPVRAGADAHRGHHVHGAGHALLRRAVEFLGEDLGDVGARHAADLHRVAFMQRYLVRGISLGAVKG